LAGIFALFTYHPLRRLKIALFVKIPLKTPLEFEQLLASVNI